MFKANNKTPELRLDVALVLLLFTFISFSLKFSFGIIRELLSNNSFDILLFVASVKVNQILMFPIIDVPSDIILNYSENMVARYL